MMKKFAISFLLTFLAVAVFQTNAQTNSKIKTLQTQKKELQKGLDKSRNALKTTDKKVKTKMRDINMITNKLENRQRYIDTIESQLKVMESQVVGLQRKVNRTQRQLSSKKADYAKALRYAYATKSVSSPLLFIFSTQSVQQMYRRSRYAREYANYQRSLAEQITGKQRQLLAEKNSLLKVKAEKNKLMNECLEQKAKLQKQQEVEKKNMAGLKKKQQSLKKEVAEQSEKLSALDKEIDKLIAYEVEQARKRAEAEAKKRAKSKSQGKTTKAATDSKQSAKSSIPSEYKWITPQDQALNSDFVRNKGRLPVPITGKYMLGSRFGTYNVPGLKNVKLDNKGTNYIGRSGAMARSIFDGEVSAVFQFGETKNVLVRHGSYISVYCNLSSVRVVKGQKIKARDILGKIEDDGSGNCILHFQLRKETVKLNPEHWIGR